MNITEINGFVINTDDISYISSVEKMANHGSFFNIITKHGNELQIYLSEIDDYSKVVKMREELKKELKK